MDKKILIFSDSLALPRSTPEVCTYEETWPVLLKNDGFNIHQLSIGGATIRELNSQMHYHFLFSPDVVIVQAGIVDCAPRALGKLELLLLNHFYITKKLLQFFLPKCYFFLRKKRNISYTTKEEYRKYINSFLKMFSGKKIYWIGILPSTEEYEKVVPGISKRIITFNGILKECLFDNYLSMDDIPKEGIMSDFMHLNAIGHSYVFNRIRSKMTS